MADLEWACGWLAESPVRLLDTVVVDEHGRLEKWLYTSTKSPVSIAVKQGPHQVTWAKVGRRFSKFALASADNTARQIAFLVLRDGSRKPIYEPAWERLIQAAPHERANLLTGVVGCQVYYQPKNVERYSVDQEGRTEDDDPVADHVARRLKDASTALREHAASRGVDFDDSRRVNFVRDDQGHLWLTHIERASANQFPYPSDEADQLFSPNDPGDGDVGQKKSDASASRLPKLGKPTFPKRLRPLSHGKKPSRGGARTAGSTCSTNNSHDDATAPTAASVPETESPQRDYKAATEALEAALTEANCRAAAGEARAETAQSKMSELGRKLAAMEARCEKAEKQRDETRIKAVLDVEAARSTSVAESALPPPSRNVANLLGQLDARERALVEAEAKWAEERRELEGKAARAASLAAVDATRRYDGLRTRFEAEQDRAAHLENELGQAKAQLNAATEAAYDASKEAETLRNELKKRDAENYAASQGLRAAASVDRAALKVSDSGSLETQGSSTTLEQSATEAKLRQLHNKVVFLKSSLAMEMEAKHEAEGKAEEALSKLESEKAAFEKRLEACVSEGHSAVEDAERRFAAALDEARQRSTHLETKLSQAQAAYADALHDAGAARRREEHAKAECAREKSTRERAERERERAELDARQALEEKAVDAANPSGQAIVEAAIVRRLENEKQYLQAQLTSEAMFKGELQEALTKATSALEEAQIQGQEAAQKAADHAKQASERADQSERRFRDLKREKTATETALDQRLKTLQDAYVKARDGLRLEQAEHAKTRMARGELLAAISQMRTDQERTAAALQDAKDRASDDLRKARVVFEEAEETARRQTSLVQAELGRTLERLAETRQKQLESDSSISKLRLDVGKAASLGAILGAQGFCVTGSGSASSNATTIARLRFEGARLFRRWAVNTRRLEAVQRADEASNEATRREEARLAPIHFETLEKQRLELENKAASDMVSQSAKLNADFDRKLAEERTLKKDAVLAGLATRDAIVAILEARLDEALACVASGEGERRALSENLRGALDRARLDETKSASGERSRRRERLVKIGHSVELSAVRLRRVRDLAANSRADIREVLGSAEHTLEMSGFLDQATELAATTAVDDAVHAASKASQAWYALETATGGHAEKKKSLLLATEAAEASAAASEAIVDFAFNGVSDSSRRAAKLAAFKRIEHVQTEADGVLQEALIKLAAERAVAYGYQKSLVLEKDATLAAKTVSETLTIELRDARDETSILRAKLEEACLTVNTLDTQRTDLRRASEAAFASLQRARDIDASILTKRLGESDAASSAAFEASRQLLTAEEERRWRGFLRDAQERADERATQAWRAGMEERDKVAKKEATELRSAAEKALAEVKASAAVSLQAVRTDTKKALDLAATTATQREAAAVIAAERRVAAKERALRLDSLEAALTAGEASKLLAVESVQKSEESLRAKLQVQFQRELKIVEDARAKSAEEASNLRQRCSGEDARAKELLMERSRAVEAAWERARAETKTSLTEAALKHDKILAFVVASSCKSANETLRLTVDALRTQAREQTTEAVERTRKKNEIKTAPLITRINDLEALSLKTEEDLVQTRKDRDTERSLKVSALAELASTQKKASITHFSLVSRGLKALGDSRLEVAQLKETSTKDLAKVERKAKRDRKTARHVRRQLERQLADCDAWRTKMHETLVNHERATLVAHKQRSAELGRDLDAIVRARDETETKKEKLLGYVDDMRSSVRALEEAMRDHGQASAIAPDGRINVAHAKKKKRMDDDHDVLLAGIEQQRAGVAQLDDELAKLNEDRDAKEDEIKALERRLVELLVSQQKRLLAILHEASSADRTLQEDLPLSDDDDDS